MGHCNPDLEAVKATLLAVKHPLDRVEDLADSYDQFHEIMRTVGLVYEAKGGKPCTITPLEVRAVRKA